MTATGLNEALEYHVVNSLGWPNLRPLQLAAVEPVRSGRDSLLIAPTAGGKTEAAVFPLLSAMVEDDWRGLTVLYVTPLKALLNNLLPRLETYAAWLGRTVALWHGDVEDGPRRRILGDPPDILLTTPESLEAMLVSRRVEHHSFFRRVRAIVVDEVHAFAGDDRGWHLVSVLERLERLAGRPIQRVGLSATVGNPESLLRWLQGSTEGRAKGQVVSEQAAAVDVSVTLDYVGSVANAATVISRLHAGEKRLVFCEARKVAEELTFELRERGVTTFVSHSSLSIDERRMSERAFAESRDCVIVATSTLELGIDVGDLDRVIQIDAPRSVASFLQRLGRTGRRPGTERNMLFLTLGGPALLRAAALLVLWQRGYVEPITPPAAPRHLAAQQLLALALQEGAFGASTWRSWWRDLPVMADGEAILAHLRGEGYFADDGGMLSIGPQAEEKFGRRYFMNLLSSFTTAWDYTVAAGRREIGTVSELALTTGSGTPATQVLLAGYAWTIESIDWDRHQVLVSEQPEKATVQWPIEPIVEAFELVQAQRSVVLGATPDVDISVRATEWLSIVRENLGPTVAEDAVVLLRNSKASELWTWAGWRANETVAAALRTRGVHATTNNTTIRLAENLPISALRDLSVVGVLPAVSPQAIRGLKFSVALPPELAESSLAARNVDAAGAQFVADAKIEIRDPRPEVPNDAP